MSSKKKNLIPVFLGGGFYIAVSIQAAAAKDMLKWCVSLYPTRAEWCQKQYPGTLDPSWLPPSAERVKPKSAASRREGLIDKPSVVIDPLLTRIAGRTDVKFPTFKRDQNGRFAVEAAKFPEAFKTAVSYAWKTFEDDSCVEQSDSKQTYCMLSNDDVTLLAVRTVGSNNTSSVVIEYVVEHEAPRRDRLIGFAIAADALSRILDPEMTDYERADMFTKLGGAYFASGRTNGWAFGRQASYKLTEDGGILTLTVAPDTSAVQRTFAGTTLHPVQALVAALDKNDLVKPDPLQAPAVVEQVNVRRSTVRELLRRLEGFRYQPMFHARGFMCCSEYSSWLDDWKTLRMPDDENVRGALLIAGYGPVQSRLYDMAWEYMHAVGRETADSMYSRKTVMKFLDGR